MKLTHIRIQNFKSILDSGKFSVSDLTCLVGKNEAGKTAALTALQSLLPYGTAQTKFDITEDYPRRFATRYDERHPNRDAVSIETWWELSELGTKILADEFGADAITSKEVKIWKRYKQEGTSWSLAIGEKKAVENAVCAHQVNAAEKAVLNNNREYPKVCVWGLAHAVKTGHLLNRSGYKIANWFLAAYYYRQAMLASLRGHSLTHLPLLSKLRIAG